MYGPSKAALINFAESLYLDLSPRGLSVFLEGFARGEFEIHFPKRLTRLAKLLRILPYRICFPLLRGAMRGR